MNRSKAASTYASRRRTAAGVGVSLMPRQARRGDSLILDRLLKREVLAHCPAFGARRRHVLVLARLVGGAVAARCGWPRAKRYRASSQRHGRCRVRWCAVVWRRGQQFAPGWRQNGDPALRRHVLVRPCTGSSDLKPAAAQPFTPHNHRSRGRRDRTELCRDGRVLSESHGRPRQWSAEPAACWLCFRRAIRHMISDCTVARD